MIHHEFNTKHCCFWRWHPFYCSYLLHISSRTCFSVDRISDKERSCKVYVGKTVWKPSWKLQPCKGEVGSIEAPWQITPAEAFLKGHSCEKWLSNYVPDFDWKYKNMFQASWVIFSRMKYHCCSIIWDWVRLSTQSIQEKQRIRPRCWKASHTYTQTHTYTHKALRVIHKLNC